jgi:hypothetical protein
VLLVSYSYVPGPSAEIPWFLKFAELFLVFGLRIDPLRASQVKMLCFKFNDIAYTLCTVMYTRTYVCLVVKTIRLTS